MNLVATLLSAAALALSATLANAQDYPSKPVTLVVPFAPGASVDLMSRLHADNVGKSIGQRIVIDNKAGSGGIVGAMAVKDSKPDGYTLFIAHIGTHAILPPMQQLPYDARKDFVAITQLISFPTFLTVPSGSPAKSAADIVKLARERSGGVRLATQGVGSGTHILGAMWQDQTKMPLEQVHYRGTSQMLPDLVAGRVDMTFSTIASTREFVRDGKLRILAIASPKRWPGLPDVPTMAEAGYPGVDQDTWFGVAAPAGTPKPIVDKLNAEFVNSSKDPALIARLNDVGVNVITSTPEEFAALWVSEEARWGRIVKTLNIKAE